MTCDENILPLDLRNFRFKFINHNYYLHTTDVTFDLSKNEIEIHNNYSESWKVTLVDTGLNTSLEVELTYC